jgi:hypothetical protein
MAIRKSKAAATPPRNRSSCLTLSIITADVSSSPPTDFHPIMPIELHWYKIVALR